MPMQVTFILAIVLAIVATVLAFVFIVPEKRRLRLNAFGKWLHDLLNFKFLFVEKVLQVMYILVTAFFLIAGVLLLFTFEESCSYNYYFDYSETEMVWAGQRAWIFLLVGPIFARLAYELVMLVVLLVKNVIQINNEMKN